MTPRERVQAALSHRKPDRIPRYEIFLPGYVEKWRQARRGNGETNIYGYYSKIDIGQVLAMQEGPFTSRISTRETGQDIYFVRDSWGRLQRCSRSGTFFEVLETALAAKESLDGLGFEDPWDKNRLKVYRDTAAGIRDRFAPVSGVMGLFMSSYYLRGELELLLDLKEDEEFCRALAGRMAEFLTFAGEKALECTDTWDTAIWVYDELGNNKSSILSPETFERVYLEPYKKMISHWKSRGAKNIILHCDGNCLALIDLLLEAGFTGIQGINPSAGMTVPAVKAKYGNRLALIGGMCNIHVLTKGSKNEIEKQARSILEAASEGGVIIGTHSIDSDIPVENYEYYYSILGD
jgi:hypothetical protein